MSLEELLSVMKNQCEGERRMWLRLCHVSGIVQVYIQKEGFTFMNTIIAKQNIYREHENFVVCERKLCLKKLTLVEWEILELQLHLYKTLNLIG